MKSPNTKPTEEIKIKKTKRNRQQTECSVIRRDKGCSICGSENIAVQGVCHCDICGKEREFLELKDKWYFFYSTNIVKCKCKETIKGYKKIYRIRRISEYSVLKCLDCGSIGTSAFCPNCKNENVYYIKNTWRSAIGNKIYCQRCGFKNYEG